MRNWIGYALQKARLVRDRISDLNRYRTYLYNHRQPLFINIGAGAFYHPLWTNVDYSSDWYAGHQKANFINYNIMDLQPLPFADDSIDLAYTSHTIEHVTTDAARHLFREICRILVPGGIFRITCPDADILCNAMESGRIEYWNWRAPWFRAKGVSAKSLTSGDYIVREIATSRSPFVSADAEKVTAAEAEREFATRERTDFLDWLVSSCHFQSDQPGLHMNWWTFEKCKKNLEEAGFNRIYRSTHGASLAAPLQNKLYFDNTRPEMSLYIDAVKK